MGDAVSVQFKRPPLLELVAELRWATPNPASISVPGFPIQVHVGSAQEDPALEAFRKVAEELGFTFVERLLPPGIAGAQGQPIYRLRRSADPVVVQAGTGVLTIHALPPYTSWSAFSPKVREIVAASLAARGDEPGPEFDVVSLRYIDAFGQRFLREMSPARFAAETLGFELGVPPAVKNARLDTAPTQLALTYGFATADRLLAQIAVSEAVINNEVSLVFNMAARAELAVEPRQEVLMDVFNRAHELIHSVFVDATQSVRDLMEPMEPSTDE